MQMDFNIKYCFMKLSEYVIYTQTMKLCSMASFFSYCLYLSWVLWKENIEEENSDGKNVNKIIVWVPNLNEECISKHAVSNHGQGPTSYGSIYLKSFHKAHNTFQEVATNNQYYPTSVKIFSQIKLELECGGVGALEMLWGPLWLEHAPGSNCV